jgi:hypothetical protein
MVETLKSLGVYENTVIWYTSDNGPEGPHGFGDFNQTDSAFNGSRYRGSTGGLRGRKRHTHEGGIRVSGIISWPAGFKKDGIKCGSVCAEPVIEPDVFISMKKLLVDYDKEVLAEGPKWWNRDKRIKDMPVN